MKKTYKVALIGCGTIAPNHIKALKDIPCCEIVALCDTNTEKAEKRKSEYELTSKIYDNYIEMFDKEKLDCVHIATPHYLHAPMAIEALKRNINVFLEKPVCINNEELEKLKDKYGLSIYKLVNIAIYNALNS